MAELVWDAVGEKTYETGVDHGVLFLPDGAGGYNDGVPWNGLVSVTESPSGAEPNPVYADNIKYLNLISAEEFAATVEAVTYPREFEQFDGLVSPVPGVAVGQQNRGRFGLCYRTKFGNDLDGDDHAYKLHLVYGCMAAPSEKGYQSINDSPEPINFSWELSTVPVAVTGLRPTSILTINSGDVAPADLAALEQILYGAVGVDPRLPLPDEVIALFGGAVVVHPAVPTFNDATDTVTIPATAGVTYYIDGEPVAAGDVVIPGPTIVEARPNAGNVFGPLDDDDWLFTPTP